MGSVLLPNFSLISISRLFEVSEYYCITTLRFFFLATQNGTLGIEKFGRLGKTVFDRAYRLVDLHRLHLVFDGGSLSVCPRGRLLALYRIGNLGC